MLMRCCLLYIQSDWAENVGTFAVPGWNDLLRPCYRCRTDPSKMYELDGIGPLSAGTLLENDEYDDYDNACSRCETTVILSNESHSYLCDLLYYDKRGDGNHGLCLKHDAKLRSLGLTAGMRVEPTETLPDIGAFFVINEFPFPVTFWNSSLETMTRHRNPLFQRRLGVSLRSLTVDILHCFYLGNFQVFACYLLWHMLEHNVWDRTGTQEEIVANSLIIVRAELQPWMKNRRRTHPLENLTELYDINPAMIGDRTSKCLKLKAAETWTFLLFAVDKFKNVTHILYYGQLLAAGNALIQLSGIWSRSPWRMPPNLVQESFDCYNRFIAVTAEIPEFHECFKPKRHLAFHMLRDLVYFGSPKAYANWLNESLNKMLKGCCRNVSQQRFEETVLAGMRHLLHRKSFSPPVAS